MTLTYPNIPKRGIVNNSEDLIHLMDYKKMCFGKMWTYIISTVI